MPRIIVTIDRVGDSNFTPPVLLDEQVEQVHLHDKHASAQLLERLMWAIDDAEQTKQAHLAERRTLRRATARDLARYDEIRLS
ncbi:MAG: hypothetical protein ABSG95_06620 [Solirubrobacteraceae bacterium]|jgi:hypothetical protein